MIEARPSAKILPFRGNDPNLVETQAAHTTPRDQPEIPVSSPLLCAVNAYTDARGGGEGLFKTPMNGVNIIRSFEERMPMQMMYRPSLCVVVQGAKRILFGEDSLDYKAMECLVVSMDVPGSGRIVQASPTEPFVGVTIEIDTAMVREVMQQIAAPPTPPASSGHCVFVGKVDAGLADSIVRLVNLAGAPEGIPVLYPSIMREIAFWLLTGPHGDKFCKLALPETHAERVSRALYLLHDKFDQPLRVDELAEVSRMSPSSFHQHFKSLTSMTPVQYQKQLRLLEARRLMVTDAANVGEAAYQVGYESASQFSREYARMFGVPPKRDVANYKAMLAYGLR
jgi:AraC-like DNA-binding protein